MPHRDCNLIHRVTIRSDVSLITEEEMLAAINGKLWMIFSGRNLLAKKLEMYLSILK